MSSAIIDGTNIDLSVFSYSAPKPNAAGGKVVNLYNKHAKESLTIAVPLMGAWGAQETKDKSGVGTGKYTMSLQFAKGQYATEDADKFLEQMKLVEKKIKEDAMMYSKEWFGKEIKSMDVMDEKFCPMLKYRKIKNSEEYNYDEPPSVTVKLPCWKDVWQTSVFDEDYNPLYVKGKSEAGVTPLNFLINSVKAPIQVVALIQCGGLWFVGSPLKVSVTWNLKQVIVRKPNVSSITDDTCFLTMKPAETHALKSAPQAEVLHDDAATVGALVEDSDGEEDYILPPPVATHVAPTASAPEPVPAPAPAAQETAQEEPAKKKKVVAKKKTDA